MRILHVIPSMNPKVGGPPQGIRNTTPELQKLNVINEVVCFDEEGLSYINDSSFMLHTLGVSIGPWAYNKKLKVWLNKNISRFDIIVIHGLWLYHCYCTYKAVKRYRLENNNSSLRLYIMPHGMLDPWFQKAVGRRLKAVRNFLYWSFFEKHVINNADGILFTCDLEEKSARETFKNYFPKKELNVGYGIPHPPSFNDDMESDFAELRSKLDGSPFILFISRIDPKKGVDILIEAYLNLQEEGYNLPKLVIAGPGLETSYGKKMLKIASECDNIIFTGMLIGNLKWSILYNCSAFILPSHQENFGIAIVEALACGKVVMITDKVNIHREINGKGGFVAEDTKLGIMDLLKQWLSLSDDKKISISKQAYMTYIESFSAQSAALKLREILNSNHDK